MSDPKTRWIRRLKSCLKAMPKDLELVAYDRRLAICEAGALRTYLDGEAEGIRGSGSAEWLDFLNHPRIHTHSESI